MIVSGKNEAVHRLSRRQFLKITAAVGGSASLFALLKNAESAVVSDTRRLMGTYVHLTLIGSPGDAHVILERVFQEMLVLESVFSLHDQKSDLVQLNNQGFLGSPPAALVDVLLEAQKLGELSGGAFDITVLPALKLMQASFAEADGPPARGHLQQAMSLVDYRKVAVRRDEIRLAQTGMELTLDGIAKGYIVDRGVGLLNESGFTDVLVEAGGDLFASGQKRQGKAWTIGIRSPRSDEILAGMTAGNRAVATSGDYMQFYTADYAHHHILDPRGGWSPAEVASATVSADRCMTADALATALVVMGVEDGLRLIESLPGTEAYLVSKNQTVHSSTGFHDFLMAG